MPRPGLRGRLAMRQRRLAFPPTHAHTRTPPMRTSAAGLRDAVHVQHRAHRRVSAVRRARGLAACALRCAELGRCIQMPTRLGVTRPWPLVCPSACSQDPACSWERRINGTTTRARRASPPTPRASDQALRRKQATPFGVHSWGQANGNTPTGRRCSPSLRSDDTLKRPY